MNAITENPSLRRIRLTRVTRAAAAACFMGSLLAGCATPPSEPVLDDSKTTHALNNLPPKPLAERVPVTIYEFRSGAPDVSAQAATDMFTTALVKSGQFRVVERQQFGHGILSEKQFNGAGQTTGNVAQKPLRGALYIFEATVSETNANQEAAQAGVSVGGLNLNHNRAKDSIAIDVRVIDAGTGDVLDSVNVSKTLDSTAAGISGTAAFASTLAAMRGVDVNPLTPDVNLQNSHKEGVDRALRSCIEASVLALAKRTSLTPTGAAP